MDNRASKTPSGPSHPAHYNALDIDASEINLPTLTSGLAPGLTSGSRDGGSPGKAVDNGGEAESGADTADTVAAIYAEDAGVLDGARFSPGAASGIPDVRGSPGLPQGVATNLNGIASVNVSATEGSATNAAAEGSATNAATEGSATHAATEGGGTIGSGNTAAPSKTATNAATSGSGSGKRGADAECAYCGISNAACIVQCNVANCKRWFCNAQTVTCGSHIVNHLVRSKHKEVLLHPGGCLGETTLECYNCGSRNIFLLGYIPAARAGVVVLLCREPCLNDNALQDSDFDLNDWQPLIENRALVSWVVNVPSPEMVRTEARDCSAQAINRIEEVWKFNTEASIHDLNKPGLEPELERVPLKFKSTAEYARVFNALVQVEADYDKKVKESQRQEHVTVRWDVALNKKRLVYFVFAKEDNESRMVVGDELRLKYEYHTPPRNLNNTNLNNTNNGNNRESAAKNVWEICGQVVRLTQTEEVCLELRCPANAPGPWDEFLTQDFIVEFVWKSTSFDRMLQALESFAKNQTGLSDFLQAKFLGHEINDDSTAQTTSQSETTMMGGGNVVGDAAGDVGELSAAGLARLNHSQTSAVRHALTNSLSLIQGPPGTGKTLTSASIVYHLVKGTLSSSVPPPSHPQHRGKHRHSDTRHSDTRHSDTRQERGRSKVLVVAPSNVAVDQLAEKISQTGVKVLRLCAKSRESISSPTDHLALHKQVAQFDLPGDKLSQELQMLLRLKQEIGELSQGDERRLRVLKSNIENELLLAADVICTTCVGAGDLRLSSYDFPQVLLDEATQATEPECLIPIVKGARKIILVGDHRQLGPVIMCKRAAKAGLSQSLFERLIALGNRPIRLEVQYRMHPSLSEFPSQSFYDGALQNGITLKERTYPALAFAWPVPAKPMFFYNSTGHEEISASGTSYLNRTEAAHIEKLVTHFIRAGLHGSQIGVITPYDGQRAYISSLFQRQTTLSSHLYAAIEVASVDAFQGREKDFILLSCVRSNHNLGIGFLQDPRRLNVALTRAKFGLVICGNAQVLARQHYQHQNPIWNSLLLHFQRHNLVAEGPFANLRPCLHLNLHQPPHNPRTTLASNAAEQDRLRNARERES